MWRVPGIPNLRFLEEAQVFKFSLILPRSVNEFTKTPSFWGHLSDAPTVRFLRKGFRDLDAGGSGSGQEGLAHEFVELFRMLLLGHHPAIIEDFERGTRV